MTGDGKWDEETKRGKGSGRKKVILSKVFPFSSEINYSHLLFVCFYLWRSFVMNGAT
jgi:hypothetical protein